VILNGVACTVRFVLPAAVPSVAEMVVLPGLTAVARPVLLIVATLVLEDVHATWLVRFCVVPLEYVPVAVNCCVAPVEIVGVAGVTAMDETVGAGPGLNTTSTQ